MDVIKEEMIMKKTFNFFGLIALAAVVFSCTKEASQAEPETAPAKENPTEVAPADQLDPSLYLVSFGATIEGIDTKASINLSTGAVSFSDGDEVLVVSGTESALYVYSGGDDNFKPKADAVSLAADVKAYYPAGSYVNNTGIVTFTMPEATTENPGTLAPMCATISGGVADFKNLGAILKVNLTGSEPVTAIELVASSPIAGSSAVNWNAGNPEIGTLGGATNVKHSFTPAIAAGTEQTLYFFLPAGITTSLEVRGIYGKTVGEVTTYEPYKKISRKEDLTTVRSKVISITKTLDCFFSGGDGSVDYPYQIASADDFKRIATLANADAAADGNGYNATAKRTFFGSAGVHYIQTAPINFGNAALTSIGVYNATAADARPFQGVYDGGNNTLSKFTVTGTQAASTGLFEYVDGATLKNIKIGECAVTGENVTGILTGRCIGSTTIENCSHTGGGQVTGRNSVGFIAHIYGSTTVENCSVSNLTVVTAASGADANNQGGVVGFAGGSSSIKSCSTSGEIQFTGSTSGVARGGIVGKFDSTGEVKDCTNGAVISNGLVNQTGGIAGALSNGSIVSCANTANVSGTSMVGGIVGFAGITTNDGSATNITFITSCRNAANVTGTANCVGGIAGKLQNGVVMSGCYTQGNVTTSTYDVGGLTGFIQINNNNATSRIYVYDCIANMNVESERTSNACRTGGAVGNISTTGQYVAMDNCGVLDVTITAGGEYVGGFAGWMTGDADNSNRARIRNCYTLVSSVPGSAKKGGFIGAVTNKAELRYDYFVADDSSDISTATTANYSKKTAAEIQSDATCTTFNGNNFTLNVGSTTYSSAKGWAMKNGYPVPGALITLGSNYYK